MSKKKSPFKAFSNTVECVELGIRFLLGILFMLFLGGLGLAVGTQIWGGIGIILMLTLSPIGFLVGFFWNEIKLLISFLIEP
jgi:hypothetical protein